MKKYSVIDALDHIGEEIELSGWVDTVRDHKKVIFIDLRDRSGRIQVVCTSDMRGLGGEDVVTIRGLIKARPERLINPKLATGTIEMEATEVTVLNKSLPLPLPIDTDGHDINEDTRIQYRYLDLRRERLQKNIIFRSKMVDTVRQFLFKHGFLEIETPYLTKATPEGSRDFMVPSRLRPGNFYALPQSPQQYKQLLQVAGFEKYFQIARCFRDEDLRADRGFEHTQIDIEMSFVDRADMMRLDEELITTVVEELGYTLKQKPFPVFTYKEAMERFGADKFDMRTDEDRANGVLAMAWVVDFPFFEKTEHGNWTFTHNPFSAPLPEYREDLLNHRNIEGILTTQYDLTCNGYEVGGGSIRSHEAPVLKAVFEIMGYTEDQINEQFGHMLEAFNYGAPPHGGIAHGIERLLMTLLDEKYLREVVAFPMTSGGRISVMEAPSPATDEQLKELGIKTR